jgi:hypothetical protein
MPDAARTITTEHRLQIERFAGRVNGNRVAEFYGCGAVFCCRATIPETNREKAKIFIESAGLDIEDAHALSIALQMAVEWVAEQRELDRREAAG